MNTAAHIIAYFYFQKLNWVILSSHPVYHDTQKTGSYSLFTFWITSYVFMVSKYCGVNHFFSYSVAYVGELFKMFDIFFFIVFAELIHDSLLI